MVLKNCRYSELAEKIKVENSRIVIYGAGMIGQIVVPYFIRSFALEEYVECYVDRDSRKQGRYVKIGSCRYKICSPECLGLLSKHMVLLLTNSKFYPVIEFLDRIQIPDSVECYIVPLIQLLETEEQENVQIGKLVSEQMIPRKIHYCWFGGKEMPEFLRRCMDTWRRHCPDYELICWNEDNYDVGRIPFASEAYREKKYGFVTDVARLDILYEHGGIYMDTDVSLIKKLDELLYQPAFTGVEKWGNINTGGMAGAVPMHPMIKEMLEYRKKFHFTIEGGSLNMETNGFYETVPFIKHGMRVDGSLQYINGMTVYPAQAFHPYDYMSCQTKTKKSTFSIHHFYGGWMEKEDQLNRGNTQAAFLSVMERINKSEEIRK